MTSTQPCRRVGRGSRTTGPEPVPVEQRQIRPHGQHITYLEAGEGNRLVVMLLHGLANNSTTRAQAVPLPGRHDSRRFAAVLHEFVRSTEPARVDRQSLRRHLQEAR